MATAAYALSPIDLIPDFIALLGYLDDVVLLHAAIWVVVAIAVGAMIYRWCFD